MLKCKKSMCFENLKVLPIWNRQQSFHFIIFGNFEAIFGKKKTSKKNFFFKIFFFKFLKMAFFEHNLARFEEKIFWKFQKKIFENFSFWKKCYFGQYFWFLIGFTHTNNLSQVLLSWLFKKFLCDMYTHCVPTHLYLPVCT